VDQKLSFDTVYGRSPAVGKPIMGGKTARGRQQGSTMTPVTGSIAHSAPALLWQDASIASGP